MRHQSAAFKLNLIATAKVGVLGDNHRAYLLDTADAVSVVHLDSQAMAPMPPPWDCLD